MEYFILLALFVLIALVSAFLLTNKRNKQERRIELEDIQQAKQHLHELDMALAEWLKELELPQFEEQTKRLEASRRLRTVLIEKLMRQKVPD